ncbi:hypothetical protein Vretimale_17022 [Volvox reticuliferus]|uniref:MYND-type domain-containing protein n=1 Tax=Volvox reticuliferus TaxID=1737510 RepID=A0A8J4GVH7_9CHLO|nr:hypothetical protein Vretifemale_18700 [Volvox reticuliferus]GIM14008.1 hypothetical protein Vretimale_17022 [Volvox reticuliferus]
MHPMPSRGSFRRTDANTRAAVPATQQPPFCEHLQRIVSGNHSFTPAEIQDTVNTVSRLAASASGGTFLYSANTQTVAGVVALWGLAVRNSGPAAQGVGEEARSCYRKLRRALLANVWAFFKMPAGAPGTSMQHLLMDLILRTHVVRGYAILLSELTEALRDRLNRRTVQAALEAMNEAVSLIYSLHTYVCSKHTCVTSQPRGPAGLFTLLHKELHVSKLFDTWSLCYLHCSKCEDVADQAARTLYRFTAILWDDSYPDALAELYMASPQLQYLTTLHCVHILNTLDGTGMYGLPDGANSLPLMTSDGRLFCANDPRTLSLALLAITLDCWCAIVDSGLNILMHADVADNMLAGLRFVLGQKVPQGLTASDLKQWALSQVRLAARADGISPLKARCVFEVCIRTICAVAHNIVRFGARMELQPSLITSAIRSSLICACLCLNFLACLDLRFDDMSMRRSDLQRPMKLWNMYLFAVETALELQQPSLRPDQLWRQRLPEQQQPLQPHSGSCRDQNGPKPHVNPMWYDILIKCPVFMVPEVKNPATERTWPSPDLMAMTAVDAGLIGLLERLMREKGCFDPVPGSVQWNKVMICGPPDHLTALLATAAKAMRRVEARWLHDRDSRQRRALPIREHLLDDLLAPLEWLSQVLDVGALCEAIEAGADHESTGDAASALGTEGEDADSSSIDDAGGSSGSSSSSSGSRGHADEHVWGKSLGRSLGLFYSFTAAHILGPASRLFRHAVMALSVSTQPPGYVLFPKLAPEYACNFIDWCMLLLTTYVRKAEMTELIEDSRSSTLLNNATATTAIPMSAAAIDEAAEWKELLLGNGVDLISVLSTCVEALRCTFHAEETPLAKSIVEALGMACRAFPKELFQAVPGLESEAAMQGGDSKDSTRTRLQFEVLVPLLGPNGLTPDAALLSALTQDRPDPKVGDASGGSKCKVEDGLRRFQAAAAMMEPPSRVRKLLPLRMCCNPSCVNLTGKSERFLPRVQCGGRGGCCGATYCSQQCKDVHWRMRHCRECEGEAG